MQRLELVLPFVLALGVGGCVQRITQLPGEAFVELSGRRAPFRDWSGVRDLCLVDEQVFTGEQQAMTALLAQWLGQTSANADGAWDDEHLALLESGVTQLPRALELQQAALDRAGKAACPFSGLGPAQELNAQAQRRVADAPWLLEQVRARLALARWKEQRPAAEAAAKEATCLTKAKPPAPLLYFAAEDETARLEWLFCDGAKVVASPGNPPAWRPSPTAKPAKKAPDPKLWLDVAAQYPPGSVSRAPKLPKKKAPPKDVGEEPI
jgi:hypothetical protein